MVTRNCVECGVRFTRGARAVRCADCAYAYSLSKVHEHNRKVRATPEGRAKHHKQNIEREKRRVDEKMARPIVCIGCGCSFKRTNRKGRAPARCPKCAEAHAAASKSAEKARYRERVRNDPARLERERAKAREYAARTRKPPQPKLCADCRVSIGVTRKRRCAECQRKRRNRMGQERWRNNPKRREQKMASKRSWHAANPDKGRVYELKRRALKRGAFVADVTADDVERMLREQRGLCVAPGCGCSLSESGYHVDHVIPLSRGGTHEPANAQLLCPRCNLKKHDLMPEEFAAKRGVLV